MIQFSNFHFWDFFSFTESIGLTDESLSTIWTEFNGTIQEVEILQNECFTDNILLINDIKMHLTDANDAYSIASKTVYEWVGLVQTLLSIHSLARKGTAHQKNLRQST